MNSEYLKKVFIGVAPWSSSSSSVVEKNIKQKMRAVIVIMRKTLFNNFHRIILAIDNESSIRWELVKDYFLGGHFVFQ